MLGPTVEPRVTGHLPQIVALIGQIIDRGHAYEAAGDVYFAVRTDPAYGGLSGRDVDALDQGEGVDGAERKRDPARCAVCKAQRPGEEPAVDPSLGTAAPGWPTSCRALADQPL